MADLRGMRVVLTRDAAGIARWKPHFEKAGIDVYEFPTIRILPVAHSHGIETVFDSLSSYQWIVITSANGADAFMRNFHDTQGSPETNFANSGIRIAAIGERTADQLRDEGFEVLFVPSNPTDATLAEELPVFEGDQVLLIRGERAFDELPKRLKERGANVTELVLYKTNLITEPDIKFAEGIESDSFDAIVFASPSAMQGFSGRVSPETFRRAKKLPVVAIGPTTARALTRAGFSHVHESHIASPKGIFQALAPLRD